MHHAISSFDYYFRQTVLDSHWIVFAFHLQAPVAPNKQIEKMVGEAARLSKLFCDRNWPIFAFLDAHYPDKPEPPYPPHCIIGTGEENFVPRRS